MNCLPDKNGREWVAIPNAKSQRLALTMALRLHLIRCDFSLQGKRFSLYLDKPIESKAGDLNLPVPLLPQIEGRFIEGSFVSLLPLPVPIHVAWIRESVTVAKNCSSFILSDDDVGHSLACLLQPYCPKFPRLAFSTTFHTTEAVAPLLPVVVGIEWPEQVIEGVKVQFRYTVFPNCEGQSQVFIERANTPSSEWIPVVMLTPASLWYTPTNADAHHFLRVSYTPVLEHGVSGPPLISMQEPKS
jgi:hypothetical protein